MLIPTKRLDVNPVSFPLSCVLLKSLTTAWWSCWTQSEALKAVSCRHSLLGSQDVDEVYFPPPIVSRLSHVLLGEGGRLVCHRRRHRRLPQPLQSRAAKCLLSLRKWPKQQQLRRTVCVGLRKSWKGLISDAAAFFLNSRLTTTIAFIS